MTQNEKINLYLKRIGFTGRADNRAGTLCRLQRLHLQSVPYENLDIVRGIPLSLETDALYEKIVARRRGGYCFELNGLFAWLLRGMGFPVTEYMARYLRDEPGGVIPMRRHRVLRVTAEGADYLCDVGVGAFVPKKPLVFTLGEVSRQGPEQYKLGKKAFFGYILYEYKYGAWSEVYSFTEEEQLNLDYIMPSFWCEKHPDSPFRSVDMVHIFTENGRKTVTGREVKLFSPNGVEVIDPSCEAEYEALLKTHFGIYL